MISGEIKRKIVTWACAVVISLAAIELFSGYYLFQSTYTEVSGLKYVVRRIRNSLIQFRGVREASVLEVRDKDINRFVEYDQQWGYKFHPFIDFTGSYEKFSEVHDYFGFRNEQDLYFDFEREYSLICLTGGSEAAGYAHRVTIGQNLENILNRQVRNRKFKVLNLAMNGYSIANEINAYVQLAYHLKPEVVISHSSWNDLLHGLMVPASFKKLGLMYKFRLEAWLPRLYDLLSVSQTTWPIEDSGKEWIVDSYFRNLEKYETIVNGNRGKFIVGIQPYNKLWKGGSYEDVLYQKVYALYGELLARVSNRPYINFNSYAEWNFADSVHTLEPDSFRTAEIYAEQIMRLLPIKR